MPGASSQRLQAPPPPAPPLPSQGSSGANDVVLLNKYIPHGVELSEEIHNHVHRTEDTGGGKVQRPYQHRKDELVITPTWRAKENTLLSFGDNGTTASVTELGQLVQMSKYLGAGRSSVFVAEPINAPEPCFLYSRAKWLRDKAHECSLDIGQDISLTDNNWQQHISFLRNRWPRIESSDGSATVVIQWMIHDGIAIQQIRVKNNSDQPLSFEHSYSAHAAIRDLDFVDGAYPFNEDIASENYASGPGPDGYGMVVIHKLPLDDLPEELPSKPTKDRVWYKKPVQDSSDEEGNADNKKAAAAQTDLGTASVDSAQKPISEQSIAYVMGFFINGKAQRAENFMVEKTLKVQPGESIELTAGFKLVLLSPSPTDWESVLLSAADVDIDQILAQTADAYCMDESLDYNMRRNMENILSVCTLPIPVEDQFGYGTREFESEGPVVALTCGDLSGHRVCASASFYAFKFLIEMAKHLRQHSGYVDSDPTNMCKKMRNRIREVCLGNLRWAFTQARMQDSTFSGNYWVNGKIINRTYVMTSDGPTDTPYQLMKAFEYYHEFSDDRRLVSHLVGGGANKSAMCWIHRLDKTNKRGAYAWRHAQNTNIGSFRLDDHVWVWNALRCVNTLLGWDSDKKSRKGRVVNEDEDTVAADLRKKYEPGKVQREILRRFTTENDYTKLRTLAVTRSARENRFLLHSRDTALFYDFPNRMLNLVDDVWRNTLSCQKYQEDNQDMVWDNPLRYALVMIMARNGFSINTLSPEEAFNRAKEVINQSMLLTGLYPGNIDETTKEEALWEDEYYRDFYFHVSFEIPYIIWEFGKFVESPIAERVDQNTLLRTSSIQPKTQRTTSLHSPYELFSTFPVDIGGVSFDRSMMDGNAKAYKEPQLMKGKIPFNMFINSQNIVEIGEEWLYDFPVFLDYEPPPESLTYTAIQDLLKGDLGDVMRSAIQAYLDRTEDPDSSYYPDTIPNEEGTYFLDSSFPYAQGNLVTDVAKKKAHGKKLSSNYTSDTSRLRRARNLWTQLKSYRRTEDAKKRLIWMPNACKDCALMCFLSAHDTEKESVSLFFEHHGGYETYFFDEAVRVQNSWETEFHTNFLQLASPKEPLRNALLEARMEGNMDINGRPLKRASAGFRFVGDFMDRYWTCYLIEFFHNKRNVQSPVQQEIELDSWRQRRVLELMLYNRIMNEMKASTKEILDLINKNLGAEAGRMSLKNLESENYFHTSIEWEVLGQILEVMEIDFSAIMDNIADWENRERDRQQEQPRWTKYDERKYRRTINKLLAHARRTTRELRRYQATVTSLKTSLATTQERIRNELDLRGNENIRYFTYATVVFLPLGFAASIFSMGEAPQHDVLIDMIITSVVGMAVTIIGILTAERILKVITKTLQWMKRLFVKDEENKGKGNSRRRGMEGAGFVHRHRAGAFSKTSPANSTIGSEVKSAERLV